MSLTAAEIRKMHRLVAEYEGVVNLKKYLEASHVAEPAADFGMFIMRLSKERWLQVVDALLEQLLIDLDHSDIEV